MRLDHLLSKENMQRRKALRTPGQAEGLGHEVSLFNLEGTPSIRRCGGLAQLGERLPCKQEVSGSIPLISTKYGPIAQLARAHD